MFCRAALQARGGLVLTAALKLLPMFVLVLPGLAVRALVLECDQGTLDASSPWCSEPEPGDRALVLLVLHEFPAGVRGLMVRAGPRT